MRRLGKHSAVYGLGGIVSRVIAVFLLPVYTRYLDPGGLRLRRTPRRALRRPGDHPPRRNLERLLPVHVRLAGSGAAAARPADVVLVHDGERDVRARRRRPLRRADRRRYSASPTRWLVRAGVRRHLGADELRAADGRVPGRGALDPLRAREPREHRRDGRGDAAADRRLGPGCARPDRRQLPRHPDRLPRAARRAPLSARPLVLTAAAAGDEPLRHPARARCPGADRDQPRRPLLHQPLRRHRGGGALRDRRPDRVGDGAPDHGLPHRVARVRVLDRGRRRGEADVRLRAHLSRRRRIVARAGARPALALARAAADDAGVLRGRARRRTARVRRCCLRRVHRDGDRRRPHEADAVQLGDHRRRRAGQRRPQPASDPALRDARLRRRGRDGIRGHVSRDDLVRAARLPDAVSVAPGAHRGRGGGRAHLGRGLDVSLAALGLSLVYPVALLLLGFFLPEERRTLSRRAGLSRT